MNRPCAFASLVCTLIVCLSSTPALAVERQDHTIAESCWNVAWLGKSLCLPNDDRKRDELRSVFQEALSADLKATREKMGLLPYNDHLRRISDLASKKDELRQQLKPYITGCGMMSVEDQLRGKKNNTSRERACLAKKRRNEAHNASVRQEVKQVEDAKQGLERKWAQFDRMKSTFRRLRKRWDQLFDIAEQVDVRDRLVPLYQELYRLRDEERQVKAEQWQTRDPAVYKRSRDLSEQIEAVRAQIHATRFRQ